MFCLDDSKFTFAHPSPSKQLSIDLQNLGLRCHRPYLVNFSLYFHSSLDSSLVQIDSEEVKRAAYAAPTAIFVAVIGTGLLGWLLNIVLVLCSGPL